MIMLLKNLEIRGLYNTYDYDVTFNDDVTFIYGMNGCGKTTVLNITEAIITGRLYKLYDYQFVSISLLYSNEVDPNLETICIKKEDSRLEVLFNGETTLVEPLSISERDQIRTSDTSNEYFVRYEVLEKIRNTFNHVYLPLNRLNYSETPSDLFRIVRNRISHYGYEALPELLSNERDFVIHRIQRLIKDKYSEIMSMISDFNNDFRNEVLKSLLLIESQKGDSLSDAIKGITQKKIDASEITSIEDSYIKILKQLNIITSDEEKAIKDFFVKFLDEYDRWKGQEKENLSIYLIDHYRQIVGLKQLVEIAQENEIKKNRAFEPINVFLTTINSFIHNETEKKEIQISSSGSSSGEIYFTIRDNEQKIGIEHLSSGEKQLLIFFATLAFEIQKDSTGIFIVDEPELSLHLSWQKKFVERALSLNSNIQLIFATHSPEIVGKYRKKMFELIKKPCVKENENDE